MEKCFLSADKYTEKTLILFVTLKYYVPSPQLFEYYN